MEQIVALGDQSFRDLQKKWYVNSTFKHTFNLSDGKSPEMFCVIAGEQKVIPGGLYLLEDDFNKLKESVLEMKSITATPAGFTLEMVNQHFLLQVEQRFDTLLKIQPLQNRQIELFLAACEQINLTTGFIYPFSAFCIPKSNPYYSLMADFSDSEEVQKVVDYLIGRGMGLTPSGDDFLLGWLLVDTLKNKHTYLRQAIEKRTKNRLFTTDISRNYLARGVRGEFSYALLAVANYLTNNDHSEAPEKIIQQVIDYGNTSGVDALAGIVSGLLIN